jgi:hypothetical protein
LFNIPLPLENKIIKIEDSKYLPISKLVSGLSAKDTLEFLKDNAIDFVVEDYIFEYNPLNYQKL